MKEWYGSRAYIVMCECPYTHSDYICESEMTDEEKANHPEYKTIGGYIQVCIVTNKDRQDWWNDLSEEDKQAVYDIPYFDAEKFRKCTGIETQTESEDKE